MKKNVKFWLAAGLITAITGTSTAAMAAGHVPFLKKTATTTTEAGKSTTTDQLIPAPHHHKLMIFGEELFTFLNLTEEQFRTETQAGKTLVEIAKGKNITEQQLIDFLTTQHTKNIDAAVTAGKLTAEQATKIKADFPARVKEMINNVMPAKGKFGGKGDRGVMMKFDQEGLLQLLGITAADLTKEAEAGKTLLEVATAHNVTEQQLTDYLTQQHTKKIDEAVAAGKLTTEQATTMKANFPEHIKMMINNKIPTGKGFEGVGGHGPGKFKIGEELFTLLGITQEQFQTEKQSGKTLLEIGTAHNVTEQQLTDFFVKQQTAVIDQALKDGRLTQAKADECKAVLPTQVKNFLNGTGSDHKSHGGKSMGGKGFKGAAGKTAPNASAKPAAPATGTAPTQQSYTL